MTALAELLPQLEAAWARSGLIDEHMLPGLTEPEIRQALAGLTDDPPAELIDWFRWHNGTPTVLPVFRMAPSGFEPLSLSLALAVRVRDLELSADAGAEAPEMDPAGLIQPEFLPIGGSAGGSILMVALAAGAWGSAGAVMRVRWDEYPFWSVQAPSLTAMVELWLTALDTGLWSWVEDGVWDFPMELPPQLRDHSELL